ncbi:MAG: FHA domain-containing protein, partial [Bacteriovoracaceae bacterium]|nr:FHA domain-containing protein [Bacteriovoracaceae bacterium]
MEPKITMSNDDTTIVLRDIKSALASAENEAQKKPAALLVVGGDLNGTIFDLEANEVTAGRNADNTIPLEFSGISRHHFKLTSTDLENWFVEDAGSKNGTYLNNKKIDFKTELNKADMIKIGVIGLKYLPKGDPERLTYDKLNLEANTDRHTGCFNKTYFNNKIDIEVKKSKVVGVPLSLILFDLDHFGNLNNNIGHDAGDYVLKEMSGLIRTNGVRDLDVF